MQTLHEQEPQGPQTGHSDTLTEGIRVRVGARLVPDQTDPSEGRWFYLYHVTIENAGDRPARLMRRHWIIRDADNLQREVRGQGVVGKQPRLEPGASFAYNSGCPLETQWGTMEGWFHFERDDGEQFAARVGRFFLAPTVAEVPELNAWVENLVPRQP
ncbi:MAG: Co2+/Mg2+ efflux protein ApaG [Planctomycetota bacterium]|nr:Co2+/Mg2+ efflux protein ApaG [Planctomycetota bacterium]